MTGIIDACLHNLYDVPRAQNVFERLRQQAGSSILGSGLYNSILQAYLGMSMKDPIKKNYWVEEAWKLYRVMESGQDDVQPSVRTYGIILALWHTYLSFFRVYEFIFTHHFFLDIRPVLWITTSSMILVRQG